MKNCFFCIYSIFFTKHNTCIFVQTKKTVTEGGGGEDRGANRKGLEGNEGDVVDGGRGKGGRGAGRGGRGAGQLTRARSSGRTEARCARFLPFAARSKTKDERVEASDS